MAYQTKGGGPDGFPALLVDGEGRTFGAFPSEAEAERVRFLLDSYAGSAPKVRPAVRPKPATERGTVSSRGAWGGEDKPRAGVVYNLSGLADPAKRRAEVVPDPFKNSRVKVASGFAGEPLKAGAWDGPHGSEVRDLGRGVFAVSFPRRPSPEVREALKAAGFRWKPARKEWHGSNLPAGYAL